MVDDMIQEVSRERSTQRYCTVFEEGSN